MTALNDIQKALNTIKRITQKEEEAIRLAALTLMAGVIGDEAREIAKQSAPKQRRQQRANIPAPNPTQATAPPISLASNKTIQTEPSLQSQSPEPAQKPIPPQ